MSSRTFLGVLLGFPLIGCSPAAAPRSNQTQGATAPSGKYVLRMPIELQTSNPVYKGTPVWKVTITDPDGRVVYKDDASERVGSLRVYWGWDDQDRVWVYSSDDGSIWRWEVTGGEWRKIESRRGDGIPEYVLPGSGKREP
jgi:hypothetical protein